MDFTLSKQQQMVQKMYKEFACRFGQALQNASILRSPLATRALWNPYGACTHVRSKMVKFPICGSSSFCKGMIYFI